MTFFDKETLKELQRSYAEISKRQDDLVDSYIARTYQNQKALEYATHGFSRRFATITRCIINVFEAVPPDGTEFPDDDQLNVATINLQAFLINLYGSLDNLAWIWVLEKPVTKGDGSDLPPSWVGLGKKCKCVRSTFSQNFQERLLAFGEWLKYVENFRHALAHRIPLYIAPYVIPHDRVEKHNELDAQILEANRKFDTLQAEALLKEQKSLVNFHPTAVHSFSEKTPEMVFHQQMLVDFFTVEEIAKLMVNELDGLLAG